MRKTRRAPAGMPPRRRCERWMHRPGQARRDAQKPRVSAATPRSRPIGTGMRKPSWRNCLG